MELICPADNWFYKTEPPFFPGQAIRYIHDVLRARGSPYQGIGLQAVVLALEQTEQEGLGQCVGLEACYGSDRYWLDVGFKPYHDITNEQLIKRAKSDGMNEAAMYFPEDKVNTFLLSMKKRYTL